MTVRIFETRLLEMPQYVVDCLRDFGDDKALFVFYFDTALTAHRDIAPMLQIASVTGAVRTPDDILERIEQERTFGTATAVKTAVCMPQSEWRRLDKSAVKLGATVSDILQVRHIYAHIAFQLGLLNRSQDELYDDMYNAPQFQEDIKVRET